MKLRLKSAIILAALLGCASAAIGAELGLGERIPNDPYLYSTGSWGQRYKDQWAHWKIGLLPMFEHRNSAWDIETGLSNPIVVAFIDTGLDYLHPEIARGNLWTNPDPGSADHARGANQRVDDFMGWNFITNTNDIWDTDGHGTFTAGIVAARINNGEGIAGINRGVKIMPLKALDFLGRGEISHVIQALVYAADHGAKVINISIEQEEIAYSNALQWAIDYAYNKGAVIVVAAGNQGRNSRAISPSGLKHVITVAGTDPDDHRLGFSNWGSPIRISAPAQEILSLRARSSDLLVMAGGKDYVPRRAFLGSDARYYHATGTSFAAPFVTGVASLILAKNSRLTPDQVEHMLLMSADDIEAPGWDELTGYGRLNARKALEADPNYYLYCELHKLTPAQDDQGNQVVQVLGTVSGSQLDRYEVSLGQKDQDLSTYKTVATKSGTKMESGVLANVPYSEVTSTGEWVVRVIAYDTAGKIRESRNSMKVE
jgi:subtilisin family serine protease